VLERCLEKRRRDRFAGISDARVEMEKALADPRGLLAKPAAESPETGRRRRVRFAAAALGAVLVAALATGLSVWHLRPSPPAPLMHFVDELQQGPAASVLSLPIVDVSRDGTRIAYFAGGRARRSNCMFERSMTRARGSFKGSQAASSAPPRGFRPMAGGLPISRRRSSLECPSKAERRSPSSEI
jgi:hypothetical protein